MRTLRRLGLQAHSTPKPLFWKGYERLAELYIYRAVPVRAVVRKEEKDGKGMKRLSTGWVGHIKKTIFTQGGSHPILLAASPCPSAANHKAAPCSGSQGSCRPPHDRPSRRGCPRVRCFLRSSYRVPHVLRSFSCRLTPHGEPVSQCPSRRAPNGVPQQAHRPCG